MCPSKLGIITSLDVWWKFTSSPWKIHGQPSGVIFRNPSMAGELIYLFPWCAFHLSTLPLRFVPCIVSGDTSGYFITGISLLQALPGEVSQCSACKPHLFSVFSAMSRAGLTTLLNDCYYTLMSWHDQGLSWRSWCWVWNMSFPLSWAASSWPRGWVVGCVSAAELSRQRKSLGCLWAISL